MNQKLLLVLLLSLLLWIIDIQIIAIATDGKWQLPGTDGYTNLLQARTWYEGHPYRIHPEEPPVTMAPDHLYPLLEAIGLVLGFRSPPSFVFFSYIFNFILLSFSIYFLFRFGSKWNENVGFHLALFSLLSFAIFGNFVLNNDFSLLFFAFSGALAFLHSRLFYFFLILTGLSRPDGIFSVLFLVYLRLTEYRNKKELILSFSGILLTLSQFVINYFIGGTFISHGVRPQSLFKYMPFYMAIETGINNFLENARSLLFGTYPFDYIIGKGGPGITQFPPFFIFLIVYGIFTAKNPRTFISSFVLFLFLLLGDSFTVFAGIHLNRHILHVIPLLLTMGILGIERIKHRGVKKGLYIYFYLYNFFVFLAGIGMTGKFCRKQILKEYALVEYLQSLGEGSLLGYSLNYYQFYLPNWKCYSLSPALNGVSGKFVGVYLRNTELFEILQDRYLDIKYYIAEGWQEDKPIQKFRKAILFKGGVPLFTPVEVWEIDLTPLEEKPPCKNILYDLDVGNPVSERNFQYHYFSSFSTQGFLQKGMEDGKEIYDGGRIIDGFEEFIIKNPERKKIALVMRTGGTFKGWERWKFNYSNVERSFPYLEFEIEVNNQTISKKRIENPSNFVIYEIDLPDSPVLKIRIKGKYISFHYWIIEK